MAERIKSGIEGLDGLIAGGFLKKNVILLSGGPGTGKSIFSTLFLLEASRKKETGIYISFEEEKDKFFENMKNIGIDLEKHDGYFVYIKVSPEDLPQMMEELEKIGKDIKSTNTTRIVVDSLNALTLMEDSDIAKRKAIFKVIDKIDEWNCTAVFTSESDLSLEKENTNEFEFYVDAVIRLYNKRLGSIRERMLEVLKMRGTSHSGKMHIMKIQDKGMKVYPQEVAFLKK